LAKQAVARQPDSNCFRNSLGIAQYGAGSWAEAVASLEKPAELNKGGGGFDWWFLAMARGRLGHPVEARKYYARAVEWTQKCKPNNDELRCFRAEAEEVIGLPAPVGARPNFCSYADPIAGNSSALSPRAKRLARPGPGMLVPRAAPSRFSSC
jgi:hypothetical protein